VEVAGVEPASEKLRKYRHSQEIGAFTTEAPTTRKYIWESIYQLKALAAKII